MVLITREKMLGEDWPRESLDDLIALPNDAEPDLFIHLASLLARDHRIDRVVALEEFDVVMVNVCERDLLPYFLAKFVQGDVFHVDAVVSEGQATEPPARITPRRKEHAGIVLSLADVPNADGNNWYKCRPHRSYSTGQIDAACSTSQNVSLGHGTHFTLTPANKTLTQFPVGPKLLQNFL